MLIEWGTFLELPRPGQCLRRGDQAAGDQSLPRASGSAISPCRMIGCTIKCMEPRRPISTDRPLPRVRSSSASAPHNFNIHATPAARLSSRIPWPASNSAPSGLNSPICDWLHSRSCRPSGVPFDTVTLHAVGPRHRRRRPHAARERTSAPAPSFSRRSTHTLPRRSPTCDHRTRRLSPRIATAEPAAHAAFGHQHAPAPRQRQRRAHCRLLVRRAPAHARRWLWRLFRAPGRVRRMETAPASLRLDRAADRARARTSKCCLDRARQLDRRLQPAIHTRRPSCAHLVDHRLNALTGQCQP